MAPPPHSPANNAEVPSLVFSMFASRGIWHAILTSSRSTQEGPSLRVSVRYRTFCDRHGFPVSDSRWRAAPRIAPPEAM